MENNFKYIVYLTINTVNNKIYIGEHKTKNPDVFDGYIGNGVNINYPSTYMNPKYPFQYAVKKYGTSSFKRSILYVFNTEKEALDKEEELVNIDFVKRKDTYNIVRGGRLKPNFYYRKKIYQFDTKGNLVKEWNDVYDAADFIETWKQSIYSAIDHKRRLLGYYWSFFKTINIEEYSSPNISQKVYKYDSTTLKCVGIYESINSAAKINGYTPGNLYTKIQSNSLTRGNYYSLKLYDEYIPSPKLSLKNKTIYVYNLNGYYEWEGSLKETYIYLGLSSNRQIYYAIKANKPIKDKLISLEKHNKITPYKKPNNKKAVLIYTKNGKFIEECESIAQACKKYKLDSSTVNKILKGTGKSTKGYTIKYKN